MTVGEYAETLAERPDGAGHEDAWTKAMPGLGFRLRAPTDIRRIQVFGERCSGTNFVARTIERVFGEDVLTDAFGFKHWFVPDQLLFTADVLVLVVARSPHDWLRSLHRQPWHTTGMAELPFSQFIRTPWASFWDEAFAGIDATHPMLGREMMHERDPATGQRFANPVALRTAKLRHWAGLTERAHNVALLGYEAIRHDTVGMLDEIAAITGLTRGPYRPVSSYKGQGFFRYQPSHYEPLGNDDRDHVAEWSDASLERLFGF